MSETCTILTATFPESNYMGAIFCLIAQEQQPSWTDDLPLCQLSGVGSAPNRSYSADGKGTETHPLEDNWLKFR